MDLLKVDSLSDFLSLCFYGLAFDTAAIFYVNILFIALSILPVFKNTNQGFQKFLFYLYFGTNLLAYSTNFIDFIYYKFTFARTTIAFLSVLENETNKATLLWSFLVTYWHVWVLFILFSIFWVYLYKKVIIKDFVPTKKVHYFGFSIVGVVFIGLLTVFGIRGWRYEKKTQPINLMDANVHVKNIAQVDIVLNTPFALIRTMFANHFSKPNFKDINEQVILKDLVPIKQYHNNPATKPNVVIMILESFSREYIGVLNKNSKIPNYEGHVSFLDSLSQHSMLYTNAYANGRQSVHAMASILAGIPSFQDAFTSSPYPKQKIESLVSVLKNEGYNTSFFHGAANGSMGFSGFGNILGIDNYYGRSEFNDDSQFDGFWGIWDEPFLQYMKKTLDKKKTPFFASAFTLSSHEPFLLPKKYKNKFKEGEMPIHKCVEYTDFALKRFFEEAK
ncbi:MAG TPA: sulfatase-like hydrolase/transferase, partial [Flavobacterium sp.]|nr:sulfatase-like hydrolase/transferase [Flavobacterium sp.]